MIGKLKSSESTRHSDQQAALFDLPGWSILALDGPDALAFAQSQLMNDVTRLADGQWQWSGWLNPKGRVIALCIALRRDAQSLWLLLPDMPAAELGTALRRYVFRSRLTLTEPDGWRVAGDISRVAGRGECIAQAADDGSQSLDFGNFDDSGAQYRRIRLLPPGSAAVDAPDPRDWSSWLHRDLLNGLPHLAAGQRELHTPQMLGLERLVAFSVNKGCYPGQEIVSRTHFLGKAKRRLARLRLAPGSPVVPGIEVTDANGRTISTLLNVVSTADAVDALAILDDKQTLLVADRPAERLPLLDELPR